LLQSIGGFDETFFMYCEDTDLCRRIRLAGHEVSYEPAATITHVGGASAPRPALLPVLASSKVRYARKHSTAIAAGLIRVGLTAGALTHVLLGRGGEATRTGHARSLRLLLSRRAGKPSRPARSSTDVVASILSERLSREDKIRE
jgi:GT2 family glycosyltransferase